MKAFLKILLVTFCCLSALWLQAQEPTVVKDLKSEWLIYEGDKYAPFIAEEGDVKTIYFLLEHSDYPDLTLEVTSNEPYSIFVNGKLLVSRSTMLRVALDSLSKIFPTPILLIGVHQEKIRPGGLQTQLVSPAPIVAESPYEMPLRFSSFRDFVIVGILILMSILIVVVQLNPKLASDYFSILKMFFMREGEDSQIHSRITSSINILFYVYCSLMIGYYLMIIFRFIPSHYVVALAFQADTFGGAMFLWMKLSAIVLAIIFLKVILVYCLAMMFGFFEIAGIHIFNWIRLLLIVFGLLTLLLFFYFISHGQNENFHIVLLQIISWLLIGWMILIVLKLSKRMTHSMFHLFSYICATELIPLLITIKVLYN